MMQRTLAVLFAVAAGTSAASASVSFYGANAGATSSTLFGGDRRLDTLGFSGSSTVFTGANFLNFTNGSLVNNVGSYGWSDAVSRDLGSGNLVSGNPDRADNATAYGGEGGGTGTLAEVFGSFGAGYKNMSYLVDGEDSEAWHMDLLFGAGKFLSADASSTSIEVSILERGGNSDFNIYGIYADLSLTAAQFVNRSSGAATGWSIDSLEIDGSQNVHAVGISLDSSWTNLIGFRIEAVNGFNGPDIVAVGTATPVPAPSALAALLGLAGLKRRRR